MNVKSRTTSWQSLSRIIAISWFVFSISAIETLGQENATDVAAGGAAAKSDANPTAPAEAKKTATGEAKKSRLRLMNGDFVDGHLSALTTPGKMAWTSPVFSSPLELEIGAVASIDIPVDVEPLPRDDGFAIRTHTGDRLWGELQSWNDKELVLQPKNLSTISLKPESIAQMKRWSQGQQILYQGPQSIDEWKPLDEVYKWSIQFGSLMSTDNGAKVRGNLKLPEKCQIDIRISWSKQPNFVIAFGVDETQTSAGKAFSFEVWDDKLALVRDVGAKADAAFLQTLDMKKLSIELTMFLDQVTGRAVVFSDQGKMLADIQLAADPATAFPCVLIENFGRELRIDQIRVLSWTDQLPSERRQVSDFVMDRLGKIYEGRVQSVDTATGMVIKGADGIETTLPIADVLEVVQSEPTPPPAASPENSSKGEKAEVNSEATAQSPAPPADKSDADPTKSATANTEPPQSTILLRDQTRLFGEWFLCDGEQIYFKPNCSVKSVSIPLSELVAFQVIKSNFKPQTSAKDGQLILDGVQLHGVLDVSEAVEGATCLRWQSRLMDNTVNLTEAADGRIDFRRLDQRVPPVVVPQQRVNGQVTRAPNQATGKKAGVPNIKLRTGEVILAEVTKIDDKGVTFASSTTQTTFVPHDRVQSVELRRVRRDRVQASQKMARLLTVPRMRKNDPPTHLVTSVDGDFLRGRLMRLDEKGVVLEVRLEENEIPLDSIAQIIWLHDRNWDVAKPEEPTASDGAKKPEVATSESASAFQVHISEKAGWKMTFQPKQVTADAIVGMNDLLGECSIELKNIELVLLGKSLQPKIREMIDNPWSLSLAKQPKIYDEADAEAEPGKVGTDSPLVGKAAPKLEGESLSGDPFKLTDLKGKIVVLDFWASWCGPCMQSMPQVDAAIRDLANPDVSLIAVNLEEPAERAQAAMERLKLDTQVVLDIDGAAGQRYQANAIPQTVIVDRKGIVRHVFVGGGPKLIEQLRKSVQNLIDEPAAP